MLVNGFEPLPIRLQGDCSTIRAKLVCLADMEEIEPSSSGFGDQCSSSVISTNGELLQCRSLPGESLAGHAFTRGIYVISIRYRFTP